MHIPVINYNDASVGDYLMSKDIRTLLQVCRSGDVNKTSLSPDCTELQVVWSYKQQLGVKVLIQDYFNTEFYGPIHEKMLSSLIKLNEETLDAGFNT